MAAPRTAADAREGSAPASCAAGSSEASASTPADAGRQGWNPIETHGDARERRRERQRTHTRDAHRPHPRAGSERNRRGRLRQPKMVKGQSKAPDLVTRDYTINLHKRLHGITFKRKAARAHPRDQKVRREGHEDLGCED